MTLRVEDKSERSGEIEDDVRIVKSYIQNTLATPIYTKDQLV